MNKYKYLVDTSYLIYYTSFSVFNSYVWQFDIEESKQNSLLDVTLDPEYCYMLQTRLKSNILKAIRQNYLLVDKSNFIFCLDCPRKNIWRRQFYPQYKISRDLNKNQPKFNISKVFKYSYQVCIPNIAEQFNAVTVSCPIAQGDDVIAVLSKKYNKEGYKVIILSADKDMVQLYDKDNIQILTIDGINRTPKTQLQSALKCKLKQDISSTDFLLYKILIRRSF